MSLAGMRGEIRSALSQIDERLIKAQGMLLAGAPRDKVEAAAELAFLRRQRLGLEGQLNELNHLPDGR